jgi:hypothetical protein
MMESNFEETLSFLALQLYAIQCDWFLIGTMSLYLQGYLVEPNDIDILCSSVAAERIANILKPYHVPFNTAVSRDKFDSLFSRYKINGINVEVMGDLKVNTHNGWVSLLKHIVQFETVTLNGYLFRVPSKADQIKIYQLFGRKKDQHILALL